MVRCRAYCIYFLAHWTLQFSVFLCMPGYPPYAATHNDQDFSFLLCKFDKVGLWDVRMWEVLSDFMFSLYFFLKKRYQPGGPAHDRAAHRPADLGQPPPRDWVRERAARRREMALAGAALCYT
jgi:hypothetical protein